MKITNQMIYDTMTRDHLFSHDNPHFCKGCGLSKDILHEIINNKKYDPNDGINEYEDKEDTEMD